MGSIGERIVEWLSPSIRQYLVQPQFDAIEGGIMMAINKEHNLF